MKDNLINILKNSDKALDIYEIQSLLGVSSIDEIRDLSDELKN